MDKQFISLQFEAMPDCSGVGPRVVLLMGPVVDIDADVDVDAGPLP